jgi:purine-binding chemotaxis protein CheW
VVQLDTGHVAFLVDEVIDVVRIAPTDVVALASYALPEPGLFSGSLPSAGVAPEFTAPADRANAEVSQYLVLDTAALLASAPLLAMARMNLTIDDKSDTAHPISAAAAGERVGASAGVPGTTKSRTLLTFDLAGEVAVLLEQVVEILPYEIASGVFAIGGALIGLMINRGQSIPLFCLQRLANFPPTAPTVETRVLVVQSGDDYVGFVVPRVRSIVPASWNPTLPANAAPDIGRYFANSRALALVGEGDDERMLRVIDLAQAVLGLRPALSAPAGVTQAPKHSRVGSAISN